jgi:hypothetical protein
MTSCSEEYGEVISAIRRLRRCGPGNCRLAEWVAQGSVGEEPL